MGKRFIQILMFHRGFAVLGLLVAVVVLGLLVAQRIGSQQLLREIQSLDLERIDRVVVAKGRDFILLDDKAAKRLAEVLNVTEAWTPRHQLIGTESTISIYSKKGDKIELIVGTDGTREQMAYIYAYRNGSINARFKNGGLMEFLKVELNTTMLGQ